MVIAFDFDETLTDIRMQRFARKCVRERNDVWVVTARRSGVHNKDLVEVLNKIGLTEMKVIYTNDKPKIELIQSINADIYIDNITTEFYSISNHTNTIPLLFTKQ